MTDSNHSHGRPYSVQVQSVQSLPFRIRLARGEADVLKAVAVRTQAYGRHVPGMEAVLKDPEPDDYRDDAVLLIAESKLDGQVLGSLRLITNLLHPLHLEHDLTLPPQFQGSKLLEAWRLTVRNCEPARMVTAALIKSSYEISFHNGIDHALVVARRPVDRLYTSMHFKDALNGEKFALSNTLNLPHGLYYLPISQADAIWKKAQCPLYPFMALTRHPDIEIDHDIVYRRFHGLAFKNTQEQARSIAL